MQQTTTQSMLSNAYIGSDGNFIHASASNVTISNVTAMDGYNIDGFTINQDGTINIPAGALPGGYTFSYTLCPVGSDVGCANGYFSLDIETTIRANPNDFSYDIEGTFISSTYSQFGVDVIGGTLQNIIGDDEYYPDCPISYSNAVSAQGHVTISNIDVTGLEGFFNINSDGDVSFTYNFEGFHDGNYPFTYTICDNIHPTICTNGYGWIYVFPRRTNKMDTNTASSNFGFDTISIIPNPSEGIYLISFQNNIKQASIIVYSLLGQELYRDEVKETNKKSIDLSTLSSGTYVLKISDGINTINKLIIKK